MHRVELNCTLDCNLACNGCNRLCGTYAPKEHMTAEAVDAYLTPHVRQRRITRLKLVGGEPLVWTEFDAGYTLLRKWHREGLMKLAVNTNGTLPRPQWTLDDGIHWYTSTPRAKQHLPYFRAPIDLGIPWSPANCRVPYRCGFSLDARGWLPCSPAIMIARVFGLLGLYREDPNRGVPWGLEDLCGYCPHSADPQWRREHAKRPAAFTDEDNTPTKSWQLALEEYGNGSLG